MDQKKTGFFLKTLRKEKNLTQEELAEKLCVSSRTLSRWETGANMPDISLLVELSEFYQVSIAEIVDGERKSEKMNEETRETAVKMVEYSQNEVKVERKKIVSLLLMVFGIFIIVTALAIFPNDSSWGSIYSILGGIFLLIGIYHRTKLTMTKLTTRVICVLFSAIVLFGIFSITDYVTVKEFHQVPRFCYLKQYGEQNGVKCIEYRTIFFDVIQKNPDMKNESVEIKQ